MPGALTASGPDATPWLHEMRVIAARANTAQAMGSPRSAIVRFADYRLDLRTGELWNGSQRVILPDQPFRILATLIRHRGELVSRDALRRELWADDTFVDFERGLNAAIKRLREMLGDSATAPRFIETIPRRGYRFIGPVVEEDAETSTPSVVPEAATTSAAVAPAGQGHWHALGRLAVVLGAVLATAGIASSFWLRGASQAISKDRLVRLTSMSGLNVDPALSADGSLLAFASDRSGTGNFDIWVQRVTGEQPVRLTTDAADDVEPSFSPDGASIAFARRETGGVYVVGTHGGAARLLAVAQRAHTPRFSPDGRSIAYWTGQTVWTLGPLSSFLPSVNAVRGDRNVAGALFVTSSEGGTPQALAGDFISARYAVWSPNGGNILFLGERATSGNYTLDWYLIRPDGSNPSPTGALDILRRSGVTGVAIPGAWTANGNVIFTTAYDDTANVWELPVSPATGRPTGVPRRLTFGTAVERDPAISQDGHIVFSSVDENADVWRVPLDATGGVAHGTLERITDDVARDELLNVSADGGLVCVPLLALVAQGNLAQGSAYESTPTAHHRGRARWSDQPRWIGRRRPKSRRGRIARRALSVEWRADHDALRSVRRGWLVVGRFANGDRASLSGPATDRRCRHAARA